jgi:rubredoxin
MKIEPNTCPKCGTPTGHNQIQMQVRKTPTITEICGACGWAYRELKDGVTNQVPYAEFEVVKAETDVKLFLTGQNK